MTCSSYHIFSKKISITSCTKHRVAKTSFIVPFPDHLISKKTLSTLSKQIGSGVKLLTYIQECLF
jgi:hypothetical protein